MSQQRTTGDGTEADESPVGSRADEQIAATSDSLLSSDRGKAHLKSVVGIYAAAGVAIGLLVIVVSATGNPIQPPESSGPGTGTNAVWEPMTATILSTWTMLATPFLASVIGVAVGLNLSRTVDDETGEVAKLAGAGTAVGTVALVVLGVVLAETEFGADTMGALMTELSLDFATLLTGAVAAAVVVGLLSAVTVYADRELTPAT
ncbi:hypothetical protein [Halovivax limisalsi]|uniref:hypothetical protein n=1 Tax=Halovivax limisalsi TaxID=1453760 RepID=UPI001FFDD3DC|nr:hypothetical protein [Halovivax limisalsi]